MNRAQLRAAVKERLRIPSGGDARLSDSAIHDCIALALNDIGEERHWPWLLATAVPAFTAGVAPLPADWAHSADFFVNSRRAKRASSLAQFLDVTADVSGCLWMEVGANLQLTPVPTQVLVAPVLWYYRSEPALTIENQSPLLPSAYHNTLIAGAAYHGNMRRKEFDAAAQDKGEYREGVNKLLKSVPPRSGPRTIRPSGASYWATWN